VLHRDIKPANVLVDLRADVLKLGDFGLARAADSQATRTGLVLGSPAYMAPELLASAAPGPTTDLYALGVTLFELLAGRLPFVHEGSMGEMLRRVAQQPAPRLLALRPALGAGAGSGLGTGLGSALGTRPDPAPGPPAAGDHFDPTEPAAPPAGSADAGQRAGGLAGADAAGGRGRPADAVVWAGVDELLARLLAKRASQRPADAEAVAGTLRALQLALPAVPR
jgi:eukaryotic-like serine/threonine-protein kinase